MAVINGMRTAKDDDAEKQTGHNEAQRDVGGKNLTRLEGGRGLDSKKRRRERETGWGGWTIRKEKKKEIIVGWEEVNIMGFGRFSCLLSVQKKGFGCRFGGGTELRQVTVRQRVREREDMDLERAKPSTQAKVGRIERKKKEGLCVQPYRTCTRTPVGQGSGVVEAG